MDYWDECIREAFEDAGITASDEQIENVAGWVEGAHENYGMAHGHDVIPNLLSQEIGELKRQLESEINKITCPDCAGKGYTVTFGPVHSAESACIMCGGGGRISL